MNVIFFISFADYIPHLFTELELMERHMRRGDHVTVIRCGRALETCHALDRSRDASETCFLCQSRFLGALQYGPRPQQLVTLQRDPRAYACEIPHFATIEELKQFAYEGIDIGRGAASSLISSILDTEPDMLVHQKRAQLYVRTGLNVYIILNELFSESRFDLLYVFNGRFAECHPALRVAEKHNVPYIAYEGTLPSVGKYRLYRNSLPHSTEANQRQVEETWNRFEDKELARKLVDEKLNYLIMGQKDYSDQNFLAAQRKGELPEGFNSKKHNIAIFNSSDDEVFCVEGAKSVKFFADQENAVGEFCDHFADNSNIHFYLRVHPRLGRVPNAQMRRILNLKRRNLTVIGPNELVDTYALALACNKVVTFGSTMGVEAAYLGKPAILCATAYYDRLNCNYVPENKEDFFDLVANLDLQPLSRDGAYRYFFFRYLMGGEEFTSKPNPALHNQEYMDKRWGYHKLALWYLGLLKVKIPIARLRIKGPILYVLQYLLDRSWIREFGNPALSSHAPPLRGKSVFRKK